MYLGRCGIRLTEEGAVVVRIPDVEAYRPPRKPKRGGGRRPLPMPPERELYALVAAFGGVRRGLQLYAARKLGVSPPTAGKWLAACGLVEGGGHNATGGATTATARRVAGTTAPALSSRDTTPTPPEDKSDGAS